jgi:hypothetical protein
VARNLAVAVVIVVAVAIAAVAVIARAIVTRRDHHDQVSPRPMLN